MTFTPSPEYPYDAATLHPPLTATQKAALLIAVAPNATPEYRQQTFGSLTDEQLIHQYTIGFNLRNTQGWTPMGVLPGQDPNATGIPGAAGVQSGINAGLGAISSVSDFLNRFWSVISNHVFWLRLLEAVIGAGLLFKGVALVTNTHPGKAISPGRNL